MRLIDADTLKVNLESTYMGYMFKGYVEKAPTVDPVVHGKWNFNGHERQRYFDSDGEEHYQSWESYKCSCCGEDGHNTLNYCPRCGAKMDGDT